MKGKKKITIVPCLKPPASSQTCFDNLHTRRIDTKMGLFFRGLPQLDPSFGLSTSTNSQVDRLIKPDNGIARKCNTQYANIDNKNRERERGEDKSPSTP